MKRIALLIIAITTLATLKANDIRVMSYNIRHCAGMQDDLNLERTAAVIEKYKPDFVALQEVDSCANRTNGIDQMRELGIHTLMHPTYAAAIPISGGKYGIGLLSHQKPISVKRIIMPSRDEDRALLVCEFNNCVIACTHLTLLDDERLAAADTIINEAQRWRKPFIIMGDLNSSPNSPTIEKLSKHFKIINNTKSPTFPADKPNECIDYIAVYNIGGADAAVRRNAWVADEPTASDHRPIVADLTLKTPAHKLFTTQPYLQDPQPTEMTVMFQTNSVAHCWIEYGEDSLITTRVRSLIAGQEECYQLSNRIRLSNLKPATRYYYRVCVVGLTLKRAYETHFGDTIKTRFYSFRTPSDKEKDFTALFFNDLHQHKPTYDSLRALVKGLDYDFVVFNGDCLPEPTDYQHAIEMIHNCTDPIDGAQKPIIFVRGNHEIRNFYSAAMHNLIGYPNSLTYGAFNWGDTRFLILDAGEDKPDSTPVYANLNDFTQLRLQQATFLRNELKSPQFLNAKRRILISHIPIFGNTDKYKPCTSLWGPMLAHQPFDLYYCAHNHKAHFFPKGTDGATFPILVGGGPQITTSAVSILSKRGKTLHLKTISPQGVLVDQDLFPPSR